jgi:pyruvate/2-oxoglutarate dehydrogenase complex dihydrolipoamide acyltransferase (E2) component
VFEFKLPQYGMGMQEGAVLRWFKAEGDTLTAGEPLLEIEAAKATVEVPSPCSGRLQRIVVPEGESVPVQSLLAVIDDGT